MNLVFVFLVVSVAAAGCAGTAKPRASISVGAPQGGGAISSSHTVLVRPIELGAGSLRQGPASPEVLNGLLAKHLRKQGVDVRTDQTLAVGAPWSLNCAVPILAYERHERLQDQVIYRGEMACTLTENTTGRVLWRQRQRHTSEKTILFNAMTKLPVSEEALLVKEAMVPLTEIIAERLHSFFTGGGLEAALAQTEEPLAAPVLSQAPAAASSETEAASPTEWRK